MVPEKKKEKRDLREELVCNVLGAWLSPDGERSLQPLCSSLQLLCVTTRAQGQHRVLFERVDAGAGRCPGAGTRQNMQEWD